METYLSKKYSGLLDIEDVESLFEKLKQTYGSIRKTANKCGVARSTAYGWEKANYVKSITKMKILKKSLEDNLIETLGFLANKSKERTSDLLLTHLSSIHQRAIREDRENFRNLLLKFLNTRREHFGLIQDTLEDEVNSMLSILAERATEFQLPLPQDSLDMLKSSYLLEIMPDLMHDLFIERAGLSEIVNTYSVPLEVPMTLKNVWKEVIPKLATTFAQQIATKGMWIDSFAIIQVGTWSGSFQEWPRVEELSRKSPRHVTLKPKRLARAHTTKTNPMTAPQYVS